MEDNLARKLQEDVPRDASELFEAMSTSQLEKIVTKEQAGKMHRALTNVSSGMASQFIAALELKGRYKLQAAQNHALLSKICSDFNVSPEYIKNALKELEEKSKPAVEQLPLHYEFEQKPLEKQINYFRLGAYRNDDLLGIPTKNFAKTAINYYINPQDKRCQKVSVGFIDIDLFKQYNDKYGQLQGDEAIKTVAKVIESQLRTDAEKPDVIVRLGGEEFLVILPDTDEAAAKIIMDRIRAKVSETKVSEYRNMHCKDGKHGYVTVSGGYVTANDLGFKEMPQEFYNDLINLASKEERTAKNTGKNRIVGRSLTPEEIAIYK